MNALSLELADGSLTGIVALYLICNIHKDLLKKIFREMNRVLKAGGLLLISFHIGDDEIIHEVERLRGESTFHWILSFIDLLSSVFLWKRPDSKSMT